MQNKEAMNRITLALKRPFVWLGRIRHRRGYGVHSPFAFNLITRVIYERAPYYKYEDLLAAEKHNKASRAWRHEPLRVKRLLFRLVNYARPATVIDAGTLSASALYLRAGRENAVYTGASSLSELFLEAGVPVDFLYLHDYRHPEFVEEVFNLCADRSSPHSVFVVEGIGYTSKMKNLWKHMQKDKRTGITFDLYDLGIIFFDKSKNKQSYIVNF